MILKENRHHKGKSSWLDDGTKWETHYEKKEWLCDLLTGKRAKILPKCRWCRMKKRGKRKAERPRWLDPVSGPEIFVGIYSTDLKVVVVDVVVVVVVLCFPRVVSYRMLRRRFPALPFCCCYLCSHSVITEIGETGWGFFYVGRPHWIIFQRGKKETKLMSK